MSTKFTTLSLCFNKYGFCEKWNWAFDVYQGVNIFWSVHVYFKYIESLYKGYMGNSQYEVLRQTSRIIL